MTFRRSPGLCKSLVRHVRRSDELSEFHRCVIYLASPERCTRAGIANGRQRLSTPSSIDVSRCFSPTSYNRARFRARSRALVSNTRLVVRKRENEIKRGRSRDSFARERLPFSSRFFIFHSFFRASPPRSPITSSFFLSLRDAYLIRD